MIPEDDYRRVLIAAPQVQAIAVVDCGEGLVDVHDAGLITAMPTRRILVRETVASLLQQVESRLPVGLRLEIHEGYIDLAQQQRYFEERLALLCQEQPGLSVEAAFTETTRLASPVRNLDGSLNIPPHSTGGAVDVALLDADGERLDFGMRIQDWATTDPAVSETRSTRVSPEARRNREILYRGMIQAGFANYYTEWWHYSHGDRYWALQWAKDRAFYASFA